MSSELELWREEALSLGLTKSETKDYVLSKEKEKQRAAERDRELQRERHEAEMLRLQAERERDREAHELAMARLQIEANHGNNNNNGNNNHTQPSHLPRLKLATYKEKDRIETFIARFEEAAEAMHYDEVAKRVQFMTLFEGHALEVIHRLDEDSREYEHMKEALLAAYGLSTDDLKKQFFSAGIREDETGSQFAARIKGYFQQWRSKDGAADTVEGIRDLILRAQFVKSCPDDLVARLKMDRVSTLDEMKIMADSFFEAHGGRKRPGRPVNWQTQPSPSGKTVQSSSEAGRPWKSGKGSHSHGFYSKSGGQSRQHKSNNLPWRQPPRGDSEKKPATGSNSSGQRA